MQLIGPALMVESALLAGMGATVLLVLWPAPASGAARSGMPESSLLLAGVLLAVACVPNQLGILCAAVAMAMTLFALNRTGLQPGFLRAGLPRQQTPVLPGPQQFAVEAGTAYRRATKMGDPCVVAVFALDNLEAIQDQFGSEAAGRVAQIFEQTCISGTEARDRHAMIGSGRFAVLFSACSIDVVLERAERVRKAFAQTTVLADGRAARGTLSVGMAGCRDGQASGNALEEAQVALGRAIRAGGNQVMDISGAVPELLNARVRANPLARPAAAGALPRLLSAGSE